jgi:hypothetical protein
VILVLPKCLLTWGYVKVEGQRSVYNTTTGIGESAGPVEI